MTPAQNFAAFSDLQALTGASDAELGEMLAYGCTRAPVANFEDAMTEHLLRLFRAITNVQWIRGWEQGARPEHQFATVWLYAAKIMSAPIIEYHRVVDGTTGLEFPDLCEVTSIDFEYHFQLDAYRDNGDANRNQFDATQQGPQLSAVDVLTRLVVAFGHPRFRDALREKCLHIGSKPFGEIRNYAKPMVQNTYEGRAGVDMYIYARVISSLRSPTYGNVDVGYVCPTSAELYPEPPPPVIC